MLGISDLPLGCYKPKSDRTVEKRTNVTSDLISYLSFIFYGAVSSVSFLMLW